MTAVPPGVEIAVAAVLAVSMGRAFFGRPPRRADGVAPAGWMLAGMLLLLTVLLAHAAAAGRELLTALAVEAMCVAGWWLRARRGEDDDGDGGSGVRDGGDGPPPVDWDAFDRERSGWRPPAQPRELV